MRFRLLASIGAVCALAIFTGSAFAGGNGNGGNSANAPGHQDAPAAAAQPAASQPAAKPAKSDKAAKHQSTEGQPTVSDNSKGIKPSSTTKHDTHELASSNKTKVYGNGKTAGQIATQAGYGSATLHGPGNSQPHKVLCGGHEVDVHALAHKGDKCSATAPVTQPATASTHEESAANCATTTQTITEHVLVGINHKTGNGKFVLIHPSTKSAHYSKHADDVPVFQDVTKTIVTPTGANCSSSAPTVIAPAAPSTQVAGVQATQMQATQAPAPAVATPVAAGSVLGATATLKPTKVASSPAKAKPAGGVLGATTRLGHTVAASRLPFTGLPLWIFTLVAALLIGAGLMVRRSGTNRV
jgi:hypothetical protein